MSINYTVDVTAEIKHRERTEITDKGGTKIGWNEANLSIIDRSRVDSAAKRNEMLN